MQGQLASSTVRVSNERPRAEPSPPFGKYHAHKTRRKHGRSKPYVVREPAPPARMDPLAESSYATGISAIYSLGGAAPRLVPLQSLFSDRYSCVVQTIQDSVKRSLAMSVRLSTIFCPVTTLYLFTLTSCFSSISLPCFVSGVSNGRVLAERTAHGAMFSLPSAPLSSPLFFPRALP